MSRGQQQCAKGSAFSVRVRDYGQQTSGNSGKILNSLVLLGGWVCNNENINLQRAGILPGQTGEGIAEQACFGTPTAILVVLCGWAELGRCRATSPHISVQKGWMRRLPVPPSPNKGSAIWTASHHTGDEIAQGCLAGCGCCLLSVCSTGAGAGKNPGTKLSYERAGSRTTGTVPFLKTDLPTQVSRPGRHTGNTHTPPGHRASPLLLCSHSLGQ